MALIPENKTWTQTNNGESGGVLHASNGADLQTQEGKLLVSNALQNTYDQGDDSTVDEETGAFEVFDDVLWSISSEIHTSGNINSQKITDTSEWSRHTESNRPNPNESLTDSVVFTGKLLVSNGTDVEAYNGSSWSSWWGGTLSQSNLGIGYPGLLDIGANGNLYVVDGGNKVHKVSPDETVNNADDTSPGNQGTLDISAIGQKIMCSGVTSSRIFYGTKDEQGSDAKIIEWDMGAQSLTPNRIHSMGVKRVLCFSVWNDTPIAMLSDGRFKYFNGAAFVDFDGVRLPESNEKLKDNIIHHNGSAIIDDLPHFLINPAVETDSSGVEDANNQKFLFPAAIYCLDPNKGIYPRFSLFNDTEQHFAVEQVGALKALNRPETKFIASYRVYDSAAIDGSSTKAIISTEQKEKTTDRKTVALFQPFETSKKILKKVGAIYKKLSAGDSIDLFYGKTALETNIVFGVWLDTKTINTTQSVTGVSKGDLLYIKSGSGAGHVTVVDSVNDSGNVVNSITVKDDASVALNDKSAVEIVNLKHMGTIKANGKEMEEFTIPVGKQSRYTWVMLVINQTSTKTVTVDYIDVE